MVFASKRRLLFVGRFVQENYHTRHASASVHPSSKRKVLTAKLNVLFSFNHQLPYGTMSDDEMRKLDVPSLQDEGYIFLWVTGR